jgi:hypothetical protein
MEGTASPARFTVVIIIGYPGTEKISESRNNFGVPLVVVIVTLYFPITAVEGIENVVVIEPSDAAVKDWEELRVAPVEELTTVSVAV